jgi:hypothetical protein
MAADYRVLIDLACLDQLPQSGRRRDDVIAYCKDLISLHHLGGDFQVVDPDSRREFEVSVIDGFIVTWWVDHPVKRVVVVDVRRVKKQG